MTKFIGAVVGIIGVFWLAFAGGAAVWWWDRRPAGTPAVHVLFLTWRAPDSLAAQAAANGTALKQCRLNVSTLGRALATQNKAVDTLKADGDRRAAAATQAAQDARAGRARSDAEVRAIMATPDTAERCPVAEALIRESIR